MTATAGMFIYIAGSDLIPQVHHHRTAPGVLVYLPFLGGIALIAALTRARRALSGCPRDVSTGSPRARSARVSAVAAPAVGARGR